MSFYPSCPDGSIECLTKEGNSVACQDKQDFADFLGVCLDAEIKNVLEIGFGRRGSIYCFGKIAKPGATIVSMFFEEKIRCRHPVPKFLEGIGFFHWLHRVLILNFGRKAPRIKELRRKLAGKKVVVLNEDSVDKKTVEKVKSIFAGKAVDLLFIDGNHSYDCAKSDYLNYFPLVREGGLIAFHDVCSMPGVIRLWAELKKSHKGAIELNASTGKYGLGYFFKEENK